MCKQCRECGGDVVDRKRDHAVFCSAACRIRFNNRRATRGQELYDLFMALRYERDLAGILGVWTFLCKLAQHYREQDLANRPGFKSWLDPKGAMDRKPWIRAKRLGPI